MTWFTKSGAPSRHRGVPATPTTPRRDRERAWSLGAGPIGVDTAVRMACDAAIRRVLVQVKSTVLDLGRAAPVVSRAQRRALAIRDGGCVEPGCTAPPHWCDAHHKLHWMFGGATDLANLELRCRRHHVFEHRRNPGGVQPARC